MGPQQFEQVLRGPDFVQRAGIVPPKETFAPDCVDQLWGDARRQLIAKAAALYIEPSSIDKNYALLRDKLF